MVAMPNQSPSRSSESCIGRRSSVKDSMATMMAVGTTLTKKMVCQP